MTWTVADVMTKEVVTVEFMADFKDCVNLMRAHRVSALPVVAEGNRLIGIVSEADLLAKEEDRERNRSSVMSSRRRRRAVARTAGSVMTAPAIAIGPSTTVPEAARTMHRERVKHLPVVDVEGRVVGIVSRSDLLKTFVRGDEEISRDIEEKVLRRMLFIDPRSVSIHVSHGVVRLTGEVETRSLAELVAQQVARVEGTVAVDSRLKFRLDDSTLRVGPPPGSLQLSASERRNL